MSKPSQTQLLKTNTILWITAMMVPALMSILSSTRIIPILIPLLLLGPMLASNGLISKACAPETPSDKDDSQPQP